jgi:hypothetical protein
MCACGVCASAANVPYIFKCLLTRALDSAERVFYDDARKKRKKQTPRPGLAHKKTHQLIVSGICALVSSEQ